MEQEHKGRVLLVIPPDQGQVLLESLRACGAEVITASSCSEARQIINSGLHLSVVFTYVSFDDGNWWSVRQEVARSYSPADVVVCLSDGGSAEKDLIERGANDVLFQPWEGQHVQSVLESAVARSQERARLMGC